MKKKGSEGLKPATDTLGVHGAMPWHARISKRNGCIRTCVQTYMCAPWHVQLRSEKMPDSDKSSGQGPHLAKLSHKSASFFSIPPGIGQESAKNRPEIGQEIGLAFFPNVTDVCKRIYGCIRTCVKTYMCALHARLRACCVRHVCSARVRARHTWNG